MPLGRIGVSPQDSFCSGCLNLAQFYCPTERRTKGSLKFQNLEFWPVSWTTHFIGFMDPTIAWPQLAAGCKFSRLLTFDGSSCWESVLSGAALVLLLSVCRSAMIASSAKFVLSFRFSEQHLKIFSLREAELAQVFHIRRRRFWRRPRCSSTCRRRGRSASRSPQFC